MKLYIRSTSSNGYLYIFKHGIGPGTLPKDVNVIRWKDLPNYYTAVWLDRFLTTEEMGQYDIPYETEINRYLDRIGYCQKNGDVVPCGDVEACDTKYFANMVSADSEISDFEKYHIAGYYDDSFRGLADSIETDNFSIALDKAHELACQGCAIKIENLDSGSAQYYSADEWLADTENGDVPYAVYELI